MFIWDIIKGCIKDSFEFSSLNKSRLRITVLENTLTQLEADQATHSKALLGRIAVGVEMNLLRQSQVLNAQN